MKKLLQTTWGQAIFVTIGTLIMTVGVYFFKFPNDFSFGGVTGVAVVIGKVTAWSPSAVTLLLNMALVGIGFLFLGRKFGVLTVYASLLMSGALWAFERVFPMQAPLTDQMMLEFLLAVLLPSIGSAILFYVGASGGGTDILAMVVKKYWGIEVGSALFAVDLLVMLAAFFVFDIRTGLFAFAGLFAKTFVINGMLENFNLCKYFNIICDKPGPICAFINTQLGRGATVSSAQGAFSQHDKYIIFTALRRSQAIQLRNFIKQVEPKAFIMISNSSEIIGRGFQE